MKNLSFRITTGYTNKISVGNVNEPFNYCTYNYIPNMFTTHRNSMLDGVFIT